VTGHTSSTNFPIASAHQGTDGGGSADAFVTKLNAAGSALTYSTYLGGSGEDGGSGIAVDSTGNAYVTGFTSSTNFPIAGAYQGANGGGYYDAFVTKLSAAGSALTYSTYLGGTGQDMGSGIAVDSAGSAYIAGYTASTNFPTASAHQGTNGGGQYDAFVTKLSAAGSALTYSTYLGGSGGDQGQGIAVDAAGSAYIAGYTASTNFPTASAYQGTNGGGTDAFVTKLSAAGSALTYSTYLGGSGDEYGSGIAVDSAGSAYVTGYTSSTNFPTASAYQGTNGGGTDAFVAKLADPELSAGTPCTAAGSCAAGLSCTDGVCCNTACTDQCAACDVSGHVGTCTPVTSAPHGSRAACGGTAACAFCDGINTKTCTYPTSSTVCGSACVSGVETDSNCNGKGDCLVGSAHSCNNLICTSDGVKCKPSCATETDCASGFTCINGACTVGATCIDDHTSQPPSGPSQNCAPYVCKNGCKTTCTSVADCWSPSVCNASGQCVAPPSSESSGGCSCNAGPASPTPWFVLLGVFGIALVRVRVRRGRR